MSRLDSYECILTVKTLSNSNFLIQWSDLHTLHIILMIGTLRFSFNDVVEDRMVKITNLPLHCKMTILPLMRG